METTFTRHAELMLALREHFGDNQPDAARLAKFVAKTDVLMVRLEHFTTPHGFERLAAGVPIHITANGTTERCTVVFEWRAFEFEPQADTSLHFGAIAARLASLDMRARALTAHLFT